MYLLVWGFWIKLAQRHCAGLPLCGVRPMMTVLLRVKSGRQLPKQMLEITQSKEFISVEIKCNHLIAQAISVEGFHVT